MKITISRSLVVASIAFGIAPHTLAQPVAPTPNPPSVTRTANPRPSHIPQSGPTQYSIGSPSDEEQAHLELINRARANPTAEGQRLAILTDPDVLSAYSFFGVDLTAMQSQFASIAFAPPLAFSSRLATSARLHSGDMFTNVFQGHSGTDGSAIDTRALAQGYDFLTIAENVYAFAKSVIQAHAAFEVDWGQGPGTANGMQTPPGHRENIHNPSLREVGIGIVFGTKSATSGGATTTVGPQLVTEDFGTEIGSGPFLTGVAYYDLNTNGFYDAGEGIGGVTVTVSNVTTFAVTASSGGYAVPLPGNGSYIVTFSATGLPSVQTSVVVTTNQNVKADFVPAYLPPTFAGGNGAFLNRTNALVFSSVGSATSYSVEKTELISYSKLEGAEGGFGGMIPATTPSYPAITNAVPASGTSCFHLALPDGSDQYLTLNATLRPAASSELIFASQLGYATSSEFALAQISTNGGTSWGNIWSQQGSGPSRETSFHTNTVSLGPFAGQFIQVRFALSTTNTYYTDTTPNFGLLLDDIRITNAEQAIAPTTSSVTTNAFDFAPTNTSTYALRIQATIGTRVLPFGPYKILSVSPTPKAQLSSPNLLAGPQIRFDAILSGGAAGSVILESSVNAAGPFTLDATVPQTISPGSQYRVTAPVSGTGRFYRLKILP